MKLKWSNQAVADVARLHDFLAQMNPTAAARAAQT
jgi:plasmid stabilization system protein ParE